MSSAGQAVGGLVGAVVGALVGGPSGALYGAQIGMGVGGYLDPPKGPRIEGPRLSDLTVQTSTYGAVIPRVYGTIALNGNVFWLENNALKEKKKTTKNKSGGKGGGGAKSTTTTYSYFATFAVGLCQGPIAGVRRIWAGSNLIYDAGSDDINTVIASNQSASGFSVYTGTESQAPNSRMQATLGAANVPGYRGLAYLVFYDFALAKYGNSLLGAPIKVEVVKVMSITPSLVQRALPTTSSWGRVVATADGVVAMGGYITNSTTAARSVDGTVWTPVTMPESSGGRYDMASDGTTVVVLRSTEGCDVSLDGGLTWRRIDSVATMIGGMPITSYSWAAIAWNGSVFAAVASSGTVCATSPDGITWTEHAMPAGHSPRAMAWNGSVFCVVCGDANSLTSPDGAIWTSHAAPSGADDVCWNGEIFCAVAYGTANLGMTSPDGVTWTPTGIGQGGNNYCVAWNGDYFLAPNYGFGYGMLSADGISWTQFSMPNGNWFDICSFNGVFVAIAQDSTTAATIVVKKTGNGELLAEILNAECLGSGLLDPGDLDVSTITPTVRGYRVGTVGAIRAAIEPLQGAFPFDVIQSGYKIKFKPRGGASVATVPAGDLAARAEGDQPGATLEVSREMDSQLPRRVTITALDYDRNYEPTEQYCERLNTDAVNVEAIDLPIVMTATECAKAAESLHYLYWLERHDVRLSLPPTYAALEPGDVITVNDQAGTHQLRTTRIGYGTDGRLDVAAKYNSSAIYTPSAVGESGGAVTETIGRDGPAVFELLDLPLMVDVNNVAGFALAVGGMFDDWPGAVVYRSDDEGQSWSEIADISPPGALIGIANNAVAANNGVLIDAASSLVVAISNGDLASVTQLAMLGGENTFAYGADGRWEVLSAQNAVQQGDGTWLLTNLLRGRFGTEWATGLHVAGDRVVQLDGGLVEFLPVNSSTIGLPRLYRAVTVNREINTAPTRNFTYRAVNLTPLSPVYLNGSRHPSSNDWTLTWIRRTRLGGEWRDGVDAALGEANEAYEVEIWTSGYAALKRTISVSSPTAAYSSANQIADFGSNQATLFLRIFQLSAIVGRGAPLVASITR